MSYLNEQVLFTIIIPAFNVEKYIKRTIESVVNQKNVSFEIIVIDDCSTDNTLPILKDLRTDYNFKLVELSTNSGVSHARNIGIEYSNGNYILFLDADDILSEGALEKLGFIISNNPNIDLVSFGFSVENNSNIKLFSNKKYDNIIFSANDFLKLYFKRTILQCMCSFIVRREIIVSNNIKFNENTYLAEDQEFQILCSYFSKKIFYKSDIMFHYIINSNSTVKKKMTIKNFTVIDVFNRLNVIFINSDLYKYFQNYALNNYYSLWRNATKQNMLIMLSEYKIHFNNKRVTLIFGNLLSFKIYLLQTVERISKNILNKIFSYF